MQPHPIPRHRRFMAACATALCAATVCAATGTVAAAPAEAKARYQSDVKACKNGRAAQDLETCLAEARNAFAAGQKGQLATDKSRLDADRKQRCAVFEGEARTACIARLSSRGKTSGSVAGGGILREVETVVTQPTAGPAPIAPGKDDPAILVPKKP